ncbi:hypothetical protein DV735_g3819, partial [Chaetothyriales sp. CBS 134920]
MNTGMQITGMVSEARQKDNQITYVSMHEAKFQLFDQAPHLIGTDGLRGCYVVLIGSRHGAILAHIGPWHIAADMLQVENLYAATREAYFTPGEVWVVAGQVLDDSEMGKAAERGKAAIMGKLAEMGLPNVPSPGYSFHWWNPEHQPSPEFKDKGTVYAGRINGKYQAWVENRLLFEWN